MQELGSKITVGRYHAEGKHVPRTLKASAENALAQFFKITPTFPHQRINWTEFNSCHTGRMS